MRVVHFRFVATVTAVILAVALGFASVDRVPAGFVGLHGERLRTPGWIVHPPLTKVVKLANPSRITLPGVRWQSREGSTLEFRLELGARFSRPLSPRLASDIRRAGVDRAIELMAQNVLAEIGRTTDTETLLSSPAATEAPLRVALETAGLDVTTLLFRSQLGDEVVRRAKTDEARRLVLPSRSRVLLIGCDGADWDVADPLIARGRMPHLARIVRQGARADLRSYDPMFSPLLWTTIATGKAPTEHGIADFMVRDADDKRRPITSEFRKVKALWNIFTDFDRASTWIGWWASYPAEPTRGLMVTDYLTGALATKSAPDAVAMPGVMHPVNALRDETSLLVRPSQVSFEDLASIIPATKEDYAAARAEIEQATSKPEERGGGTQNPVAFVIRVLAVTYTSHNIAVAQLRAGVPFVGVYFEGIDMMGHGFQHYMAPKMSIVTATEHERFRDAVENFYALQDRLLGELLRAAGENTVTMIVSDHGFRTGSGRPNFAPSTKGQPEEWHREWGILALHGPGIRAGVLPPASIYDVAPTLLYLAGLPVADDMSGKVVMSAIDADLLRSRPPARIRSYELVGERLEHSPAERPDPAAMKEMMANLRALGYVGGAAEDDATPTDVSAATADAAPETLYFFHRNLAVSYIRQGRLADAEAELLLANQKKKQGKTYEMLSQVRARQGHYREAVDALREGLETIPTAMDPGTVLWIIELELLAGNPVGAREAASRWSASAIPAVRLAVDGRLRDADGDVIGAMDNYRSALDADPLLVRIAQRLHELESGAGHPYAIEAFLLRTLAVHPQVDAYWDMAGQMAMSRADYAEAVRRLEKASALQPDDGLYLGHLASALAAAGRMEDARDKLAWADRVPHTTADAWMALGSAWDRVGDPNRAVRAFEAAKSAGFRGPGADIGAVLALARAGRTADAFRVLSEAEARFPKSQALAQLRGRLAH